MGVKFSMEEGTLRPSLRHYLPTSLPHTPSLFPFSLALTALGVLRMLPVLQRLGDAYGFYALK